MDLLDTIEQLIAEIRLLGADTDDLNQQLAEIHEDSMGLMEAPDLLAQALDAYLAAGGSEYSDIAAEATEALGVL